MELFLYYLWLSGICLGLLWIRSCNKKLVKATPSLKLQISYKDALGCEIDCGILEVVLDENIQDQVFTYIQPRLGNRDKLFKVNSKPVGGVL